MGIGKIRNACFKQKHRWMFTIAGVSEEGVRALPPNKSARPSLAFKEIEVQHVNEVIYLPGKPDWKPINLVLYDIKKNNHPVFEWIKNHIYNPKTGDYKLDPKFKKTAKLELFDGCGTVIEKWVFEEAWPNNIEWGDLDMATSDIVVVDLTLRYSRAYLEPIGGGGSGGDIAASQPFIDSQISNVGGIA